MIQQATRVNPSVRSDAHIPLLSLSNLKTFSKPLHGKILKELIEQTFKQLKFDIPIEHDFLIQKLNLNNSRSSAAARTSIITYARTFLKNDIIYDLIKQMPPVATRVFKNDNLFLPFKSHSIIYNGSEYFPIHYFDFKNSIRINFTCLNLNDIVSFIKLTTGVIINPDDEMKYNSDYNYRGIILNVDKQHNLSIKGEHISLIKPFIVQYLKNVTRGTLAVNY